MPNPYLEKRREPRRGSDSRLAIQSPVAGRIEGQLVDVSAHGFRASHSCHALTPGEEVIFEHDQSSGRARVVWNRILAGAVETGFFVLGASRA